MCFIALATTIVRLWQRVIFIILMRKQYSTSFMTIAAFKDTRSTHTWTFVLAIFSEKFIDYLSTVPHKWTITFLFCITKWYSCCKNHLQQCRNIHCFFFCVVKTIKSMNTSEICSSVWFHFREYRIKSKIVKMKLFFSLIFLLLVIAKI